MRVEWSPIAEESWREIASYVYGRFGSIALLDFSELTDSWIDTLSKNPHIAKEEPLLQNREKQYQSIPIHKLCKLVFYVEDEVIYIADVWDTRRNPATLQNKI